MPDMKWIILNALEYCSETSKGRMTSKDVAEELKTQNNLVHSKFRHSIAVDVAALINEHFGNAVKYVYLYGSTMEYNAGKYSDIDMIILADKMGKEIDESIKSIDQSLTEEYYGLIEESRSQYAYILDIKIIDREAVGGTYSSHAYLEYILNNGSIPIYQQSA